MSERMDEICRIVERLRLSRIDPAVVAPTNADLSRAIELLGGVTERKDLHESLARAMQQTPVVLSREFADSLGLLCADVARLLSTDPAKRRAFEYRPNRIALSDRVNNFFFAFALLAYGVVAVRIDDFFIPAKNGPGVHLHGTPVWIMLGAVACAAVVLLMTIVDHYDRRDNERHYQRLARIFRAAGWGLFAAALALHLGKGLGVLAP